MTSGRRPFSTKKDIVYEFVKNNPGVHKARLADVLGHKSNHGADAILVIMEQRGYLIYEDEYGHIFTWDIFDSEKGNAAK